MVQGQTLKSVVLFLFAIECVLTFEILIAERINGVDKNIQQLRLNENKSCEIPLFQTRYVTIRLHPTDLHKRGNGGGRDIVGFKVQIKSSLANVVKITKDLDKTTGPSNIDDTKSVIAEDLFICK